MNEDIEKRIENLEKRLYYVEKLKTHSTVATVPTWTPRTFQEMFEVYDTGIERGIHIYINGNWRTEILT